MSNYTVPDATALADLVKQAAPAKGHKKLLADIHRLFPQSVYKLAATEDNVFRSGCIFDANGNRLGSVKTWLQDAYAAAGQDAGKVWQTWKDKGLIVSEQKLERIYLAFQYGPGPADFIQIELFMIQEVAEHELFGGYALNKPRDFGDLCEGGFVGMICKGDPVANTPIDDAYYEFRRVTDIAAFVREAQALDTQKRIARIPELQRKTIRLVELGPDAGPARDVPFFEQVPDYLRYRMGLTRLMEDWTESAGRSGAVYSDHWSLQLSDYTHEGQRHMDAIPVWITKKKLPKIAFQGRMSVFALMDKLQAFDLKVGHPFAWFFFMTHGNRLSHIEGKAIYEAVNAGEIRLPAHDWAVLERWYECPYAF